MPRNHEVGNGHINATMKYVRVNHCCLGKGISIAYCECVSIALVIRRAKRMRYVMSSFAPLALPCFPTSSHNRHDFRKNVIEHEMCAVNFGTIFV